jgi:hypothetical protein
MEMLIEVHTTKLYRNKQMNNDDNIFQFLDYVQVSVFQGFIQQWKVVLCKSIIYKR